MRSQGSSAKELIQKIQNLPPDKAGEVEDFVDFLLAKKMESRLTRAVSKLSEKTFEKIWDNPNDAEYDKL